MPPARTTGAGVPFARGSPADAQSVSAWVRRNPYASLAGAVGIGFIVGGGLFTRLAARLVGTGLRMGLLAAAPLLRDGLIRQVNEVVTEKGR